MTGAMRLHATTIAIEGLGVLLRGPSGVGKSDLALRLIDGGAELVADDQTELERRGDRVWASAPSTIAGMLEVRGIGIVGIPSRTDAPVAMVIDLVEPDRVERLPEPSTVTLLAVPVTLYRLDPRGASAAAKVRLAVRQLRGNTMAPP